MKKILFITTIFLFLCFFFIPETFIEAAFQPKPLEVDYPDIPGVPTPSMGGGISNYVKYIFNFAIWISGFIALAVLIYAGFEYFTSAGNPEKIRDAKDRITAAFLGLVILFGSYLILVNINPQLISFNLESIEPILSTLKPGVLLCKEPVDEVFNFSAIRDSAKGKTLEEQEIIQQQLDEILGKISEKCWYASPSGPVSKKFDNKAKWAYVIPSGNTKYGAILYDESDFRGKSQMVYRLQAEIAKYEIKIHPSSFRCFVLNDEPSLDWYAEIYELKDYNEADSTANHKPYGHNDLAVIAPCYDILNDFPHVPVTGRDHQFQSVKIEGNLIVVFFAVGKCADSWNPDTEIYALVQSDHNLNDNDPLDDWNERVFPSTHLNFPAATSMVIVSADMF